MQPFCHLSASLCRNVGVSSAVCPNLRHDHGLHTMAKIGQGCATQANSYVRHRCLPSVPCCTALSPSVAGLQTDHRCQGFPMSASMLRPNNGGSDLPMQEHTNKYTPPSPVPDIRSPLIILILGKTGRSAGVSLLGSSTSRCAAVRDGHAKESPVRCSRMSTNTILGYKLLPALSVRVPC